MTTSLYYIVISPPSWIDIDEMYSLMCKEFSEELKDSHIVKETGKDGLHPHLNIITTHCITHAEFFSWCEFYVSDNYRYANRSKRKVTKDMRLHMYEIKQVYDLTTLANYLIKEPNAVVLRSNPELFDTTLDFEFTYVPMKDKLSEYIINLKNFLANFPIIEQIKALRDLHSLTPYIYRMVRHSGCHISTYLKLRDKEAIVTGVKFELNLEKI